MESEPTASKIRVAAKVAIFTLVMVAHPTGEPAHGRLADGVRIPLIRTGRYPSTEEVLSALGVVANKRNLGAIADIIVEVCAAVAGRTSQFAGLVPRLADLAGALDRQTDDIIDAVAGVDRFAAILARFQHADRAHP